ncbi:MAG: hypothetical protein Fur0037_17730 [Planctomycetota bacterium]
MAPAEGLTSLLWVSVCSVLAPAWLGAGVVRFIGLSSSDGWRQFAFWSYLVGQVVQAALTALWLAAGKPVPGPCLPLVAFALGSCLILRVRRSAAGSGARRVPRDPWICALAAILVLIHMDQCLLRNLHPIISTDEASIWSSKARLLYSADDMGSWFSLHYARNPSYPMFNPLMQVLAYASSGRVLWWENRLPLQAFSLTVLLQLSAVVEQMLPRWLGAVLLIAFASSSSLLSWGSTVYSDLLVGCTLLAVMCAWMRFEAERERMPWRLFCLSLCGLLSSKHEGFMLAIAFAVAVVSTRALLKKRLLPASLGMDWWWALAPAAAVLAGQWFNWHFGLSSRPDAPAFAHVSKVADLIGVLPRMASHIPQAFQSYASLLLEIGVTRWLLALGALSPLLWRRGSLEPARAWSWAAIALSLGGYVLVYACIATDQGDAREAARRLEWYAKYGFDRTMLHMLPAAVLALALNLRRDARMHGT